MGTSGPGGSGGGLIGTASVIAVDDDATVRGLLGRMLSGAGSFAAFATAEEFLSGAEPGTCDILLIDLNLAGADGLALTRRVKALAPHCDVIVITGEATLDNALAAIKTGAYDFVTKPFSDEQLLAAVERCLEKRRISSELSEVKAAREELSAAYAQLGAVERLKEAFLSVIGHELRTPLAKILAGAEALEGAAGEEDRLALLGAVKRGASELRETLENLILYADSRKTPLPAACDAMDLAALSGEVCAGLSQKAAAAGVEITVHSAGEKAMITGNGALVREAVRQLVLNAIRFNREGGSVAVRVSRSPAATAVTVSDTGIGIPAELLSGLGNPFYQAADYLTRKSGGLGLGLAIVKNVAEAHKGWVSVKNVPGGGAAFTAAFGNGDPCSP